MWKKNASHASCSGRTPKNVFVLSHRFQPNRCRRDAPSFLWSTLTSPVWPLDIRPAADMESGGTSVYKQTGPRYSRIPDQHSCAEPSSHHRSETETRERVAGRPFPERISPSGRLLRLSCRTRARVCERFCGFVCLTQACNRACTPVWVYFGPVPMFVHHLLLVFLCLSVFVSCMLYVYV